MRTPIISDSELVSSYIDGNEKSIEILIKRHKQRIYSFIYSKVLDRDLTEDVFQDTFIKVVRTLKLGNYNEEGKFVSWVMRIAHNLIIDHFRSVHSQCLKTGKIVWGIWGWGPCPQQGGSPGAPLITWDSGYYMLLFNLIHIQSLCTICK